MSNEVALNVTKALNQVNIFFLIIQLSKPVFILFSELAEFFGIFLL